MDIFFSGESEFSLSTVALLTLLSEWATSLSQRPGASDVRLAARTFMSVFLDRIVGKKTYCVRVDDSLIRLENGHVILTG